MDCKISPTFQMGYLYTFCAEEGTCKCYCDFTSGPSEGTGSLDDCRTLLLGFTHPTNRFGT